ncbi:MAG: hypothetical protein Q8M08_17460 [Bacteroidales bacterium]|nr:hypothetical protein [Bacteroidales bacterium]
MINIVTTPEETFFAGNPALFRIHSDNMLSSQGTNCHFYLVVSAADTVAGHDLIFQFPDRTITFLTALVPDDSGLQIPTALNSANWATWAQSLYDCLCSNFYICSRFQVTIADAGPSNRIIFLSAYEKGTASSAIVTSRLITVTLYDYVAGANPVQRNNFSIVAGIWDSNNKQLAQDVKPVNAIGDATFNFSEYLSVLLQNDVQPRFTWPFDPSRLYQFFQNYVLPFYAGFAERYDGIVRKLTFDTTRHAIPGGLNRETMVAYNSFSQSFFQVPENQLSFMTWAPASKMTSKTSPELLFFLISSKPSFDMLLLAVIVTFDDGDVDSFSINISEINPNAVIELSVGYEHLQLELRFPGHTISSWQVFLAHQDLHIETERKTFVLDNRFYESERVFIFQNSFGRAYDVVRFTGTGSTNIDVDFSTSSSETIGNYTSFNAPVSKFRTSEMQKMKCNSGWISRETKDYLRELLLSQQVFEYREKSLFPLIITNDMIKEFFKDDEYLYDLEIDYDRAYRDFFFQSS